MWGHVAFVLSLTAILLVSECEGLTIVAVGRIPNQRSSHLVRPPLHATTEGSSESSIPDKQPKAKATGVYVRPSGAIERGSGFFVPGLEGPRVRLVFGTGLLVLTAVNHFLGNNIGGSMAMSDDDIDTSQPSLFEETMAVAYSLLILFQAAIEYAKEVQQTEGAVVFGSGKGSQGKSSRMQPLTSLRRTDNNVILDQQWADLGVAAMDVDHSYQSNVQWAAASYMAMTPTTQMLLLTSEPPVSSSYWPRPTVLYRLRRGEVFVGLATLPDLSYQEQERVGVTAALQELQKSRGGRIALPLTHPAVEALVINNNSSYATGPSSSSGTEKNGGSLRTVILQRITDNSCWLVASNQLLAGFTRDDLKWLGQMAVYVSKW